MHVMDCSCAPILQFFSAASIGATAERQIQSRIFGQFFFTNLRKDNVANYASVWTLCSPSVRGPDVLCNALNIRISVSRWRHKIRKFVVEILQKRKNSAAGMV